ncbi:hypothetical protein GCM10010965_27360 [Caldalkalibacillus thermarum]|nr:hypothetical protein [Caldalkalibacillus thermarum]GGK33002.1 hypothetical protein GCM10010965_27360 [Caldalkalibacillus thermarum]
MTKKQTDTPRGITVTRTYTPDKEAMKKAIMLILRSSPKTEK